jgi:hypothetical protein
VKRLIAWLAGAAGGLAAFRALHRALGGQRPADTGADARAAELKAKLEEARAVADDRDAFEGGEVAVDEAVPLDPAAPVLDPAAPVLDPAAPVLDPAARRAQVHEQGRAALDEMRGDQA